MFLLKKSVYVPLEQQILFQHILTYSDISQHIQTYVSKHIQTSDVQFQQKSIPIQFRFRAKPFNSIPIPIPCDFSLRFNSDSNSIGPKIPGIPIPVPIPESELHITDPNIWRTYMA